MDRCIEHSKSGKKLRKIFDNYNDELKTLWKSISELEKQFHRCKDEYLKSKYKMTFKDARYMFGKYFRKTERQYNKQFGEKIDELNDKKTCDNFGTTSLN